MVTLKNLLEVVIISNGKCLLVSVLPAGFHRPTCSFRNNTCPIQVHYEPRTHLPSLGTLIVYFVGSSLGSMGADDDG